MFTLQKTVISLSLIVVAFSHIALGASIKIIGGTEAAEEEFPFLVAIQYKGRNGANNTHNCGGTLVNMTRVITAAHCVEDVRKEEFTVVAGTHLLSEAMRGIQQNRDISNIAIRRDYEGTHNDIAVIDLSSPFQEEPRIRSIRMASRDQISRGKCLIAGWGATNSATSSEKLLKAELTINSIQQCTTAQPEFDPERQICAGSLNGETANICTGDTGGGLYCTDGEGLYLAGVASWGAACDSRRPGVYMDIGRYRSWVDAVVYEDPHATTTPSSTTNSPFEGSEENGGDNSNNTSKPENHKPIVPCRVRN